MAHVPPRRHRDRPADPRSARRLARCASRARACGPPAVAQVASPLVSERLTPDVVAKVARLARLELTTEELDAATHHLGDMLDHFAEIDALDLSGVEPMNQAHPLVNVLRDDVEAPCLDR